MTRSRSQGGFALLMALVVLGTFSVIMLVLLSMVDTDSRTTAGFDTSARDSRAAYGAIMTASTRLKTMTAAQLDANGGCGDVDGAAAAFGGRAVTVRCSSRPASLPDVPSTGDGATVLTLLGNYNGVLDDGVDNQIGGPLGSWVSGAATMLNNFIRNGPGLIHAGTEPLRIVGSVGVRQSALAIRQPATYPAIDIDGSFREGDPGPLGSENLAGYGWTTPCGLLDQNIGGHELGTRIRATTAPQCSLGRDAVVGANGPAVTAPAAWTASTIAAHRVALPACPSPGGVATFSPGAYTPQQVTTMNVWFQQGTCDGVTFWFQPGDYYFDSSGWFGDARSSIVMNDPTANWVFGEPRGWTASSAAPASAFPQACDTTRPGVSITLSSRTAIKHSGGRVAICGRDPSMPTIFQQSSTTPQEWAGEPDTAVAGAAAAATVGAKDPMNATRTIGPAPAGYPVDGKAWDQSEGSAETDRKSATTPTPCTSYCDTVLVLSGFGDANRPAPAGPLTKASLLIRGTATNYDLYHPNSKVIAVIDMNDGTGRACSITRRQIPVGNATFEIPLLTAPNALDANNPVLDNSCPGILADAMDLENARVTLHVLAQPYQYCQWFSCTTFPVSVAIDYVWMTTTTGSVAPPSPIATVVAPDRGTSLHVFGSVYAPRSQVEVRWSGTTESVPVFVGGVVARGLASSSDVNGGHVGTLVSRSLAASGRRVTLTAIIGGRVRATATVVIDDMSPDRLIRDPGRTLEVSDWMVCNRPASAGSCA